MRYRLLEALEANSQSSLDASAAELQKAREDWKAAIAEAARKREAKPGNEEADSGPGTSKKIEELETQIKAAGPTLNKASNSIASTGTFSAQFAGRMIAGSAAERTAEFIEKLYEEQKRANKKAEREGQTFTFSGANSPM